MLTPTMRGIIRSRGLLPDINQVIALTEWLYKDAPDKEFMNAVQREVYAVLRNDGFKRAKNAPTYNDPIIPFSVAMHANQLPERDRIHLLIEMDKYHVHDHY